MPREDLLDLPGVAAVVHDYELVVREALRHHAFDGALEQQRTVARAHDDGDLHRPDSTAGVSRSLGRRCSKASGS